MTDRSDIFPHTIFAVRERPYCVWDQDLKKNNLSFCDGLDPDWFLGQAERQFSGLEDGDEISPAAALGIRLIYYHALETFIALLFAAFQAPHCVPGWLDLYRGWELRGLTENVNRGEPILNAWGEPTPGWQGLSRLFNQGWAAETEDGQQTIEDFGNAWSRLGREFLDERTRSEYNSVKHGLRARPGGFALKVGLEKEPGKPADPDAMRLLGASEYGSSILKVEPLDPEGTKRRATHVRLSSSAMNWSVENTIKKLQVIVVSLNNIIGAIRIRNGVAPGEVRFDRFADRESFEDPWRTTVGVSQFNWKFSGPPRDVLEISREQLLTRLRDASGLD